LKVASLLEKLIKST